MMITDEQKHTQVIILDVARKCRELEKDFTVDVSGNLPRELVEAVRWKMILHAITHKIQVDSMSN